MTNSLRNYTGRKGRKVFVLIILFSKYNFLKRLFFWKQISSDIYLVFVVIIQRAWVPPQPILSFACLSFSIFLHFFLPSFPSLPTPFPSPSLPFCLYPFFTPFFLLSFFADMYSNFSKFAVWLKTQSLSENTFYHFQHIISALIHGLNFCPWILRHKVERI